MVRQYLSIKEQYPDCILFFRMGDFYEMFYEDAEVASKALNITLTTRNKGMAESTPLCGVPYHAADNYLSKLVEAGFKVAVCEQVEDPKKAKGIVKRAVTRVVTRGDHHISRPSSSKRIAIYGLSLNRWGLSLWVVFPGLFDRQVHDYRAWQHC